MVRERLRHVAACFLLALASLSGCDEAMGAGAFAFPPGDAARGRAAFEALGCGGCHAVSGVTDLPPPGVSPPVPLLGGRVPNLPSEAYLVTAIVNPDHAVRRNFIVPVTTDGTHTRMGDYTDRLTVRELLDLVAFLRPRYELRILF